MAHVAIVGHIGGQRPSLVTLSTPATNVLVGNFAATDRAGALRAAFDTLTQDDLTGCQCGYVPGDAGHELHCPVR